MKYLLFNTRIKYSILLLLYITDAICAENKTGNVRIAQMADFLYVYNEHFTTLTGIDSRIPFSNNGPISGGFTHNAGEAEVFVLNAGTYKINYTVSGSTLSELVLSQYAIL